MISAVQNFQTTSKKLTFKASNDVNKSEQQEKNPVYKTHAGLKTGIGFGIIESLLASLFALGAAFGANFIKNMGDLDGLSEFGVKTLEKNSRALLIYIPIVILTALGCGAFIDKKINGKKAQFADKLEKEGKKEVLKNEDNAEITQNEQVYCKTNIGKKLGTILGVVAHPLLGFSNIKLSGGKFNAINVISYAISGAIGGLILGAITDKVANKGAAKFADKQVIINSKNN